MLRGEGRSPVPNPEIEFNEWEHWQVEAKPVRLPQEGT